MIYRGLKKKYMKIEEKKEEISVQNLSENKLKSKEFDSNMLGQIQKEITKVFLIFAKFMHLD